VSSVATSTSAPFLTQIDSRAAVRGSRDPLSLVPIWSAFGRRVVGNLTTASTSLRGFTTLLLGYYCADRVLEKDGDQTPLSVFLRTEQFVSYARNFRNSKDTDFRGSERVKKRLADSSRITLSAEPRYQILGDQKTYGLWGLYSVASRTSGFLLPDRPSLTPDATDFVEREYVHRLVRAGLGGANALLEAIAPVKKEIDLKGKAGDLAHVLATIHSSKVNADEKTVYQNFLVDGGDEENTGGHQRQLAELLDGITTDDFAMADFQRVLRLAEKKKYEELAGRLDSIRRLEGLIVAAASLFAFLLRCDGRTLDAVERDVRLAWGRGLKTIQPAVVEAVEKEIERIAQAPESAAYLGQFGRHAGGGDWRAAAEGLIDFNAFVMKRRGGAPWIRRERATIKVDYREEGADLADLAELEQPWQNTYFINALYGVKRALAGN
jgi:hypothetical protein